MNTFSKLKSGTRVSFRKGDDEPFDVEFSRHAATPHLSFFKAGAKAAYHLTPMSVDEVYTWLKAEEANGMAMYVHMPAPAPKPAPVEAPKVEVAPAAPVKIAAPKVETLPAAPVKIAAPKVEVATSKAKKSAKKSK